MNRFNVSYEYSLSEGIDVVKDNNSNRLYVRRMLPADMKPVLTALSHINNPHIMKVYDVWSETHGETSVCMCLCEFIDGGETIEQIISRGATFDEANARRIMIDICDGLTSLHERGIIHRDIKPSNIMVEGQSVKIIDYDIVRSKKSDSSKDTHILGSVGYAAPEQFGFAQSDETTDIYACGVLLNVMCTGKLPNEAMANGSLGRIVKTCTMIDKEKRFKNAKELSDALHNKHFRSINSLFPLPGFKKHKVLTSFGYIFFIMLLINNIIDANIKLIICTNILLMLIPYICFGDLGHISEFLDKTDPRSGKNKLTLIGCASIVLSFLLNRFL